MAKNRPLLAGLNKIMIQDVPKYANKFLYSLGFLSMICFVILIATGVVMAFYGPDWWLLSSAGKYFRSVHLWATQAFVLFVILHLIIVFFTSGFKKPRRLTWVFGTLMFIFLIFEAEFGYVLRGDYSSQWRSLQGADLYNGTGMGWWINNLNYKQIYGIHIAVIPVLLIGLLFFHYLLVRVLGIAKPHAKYKKEVPTVKANHTVLFARGGVLIGLILLLAAIFPSPYLKPETVKSVAEADQKLVAQTLMKEFDGSSDTAGYMDSIQPYTYDTKAVYISGPYNQLLAVQKQPNLLDKFNALPQAKQDEMVKQAQDYFNNTYPAKPDANNPLEAVIISLANLAASGYYEPALNTANQSNDKTYGLRFLADTGVLEARAGDLGITTEQYGMLFEEQGKIPPGAWWLAPIGLLNHTVLASDDNGDRDGAIILGSFLLLLLAFPFIPGLNRLPEWLKVYKLIWK